MWFLSLRHAGLKESLRSLVQLQIGLQPVLDHIIHELCGLENLEIIQPGKQEIIQPVWAACSRAALPPQS